MQMTKTAAIAILAFVSSAAAYYPAGYGYELSARDAYAYAEPEEFDDIFARDAEADFEYEIMARDAAAEAYEQGFQHGVYARAIQQQQQQQGARPNTPTNKAQALKAQTPQDRVKNDQNRIGKINTNEEGAFKDEKNRDSQLNKDNLEIAKLRKEMGLDMKNEGTQRQGLKTDGNRVNADNKAAGAYRVDMLKNNVAARDFLYEYGYDY